MEFQQDMTIKNKIRDLLNVMGTKEVFKQKMGELLDKQRKHYTEMPDVFHDKLKEKVLSIDLIGGMIPIWEEHYSEDEIDALITFYGSPVGQKIIRTQHEMMFKQQEVLMKYFEEIGKFVTNELVEESLGLDPHKLGDTDETEEEEEEEDEEDR